MTHRDFCYWLQGLLECGNPETLDKNQVAMIKEHLQLTFTKETKPLTDLQHCYPSIYPMPNPQTLVLETDTEGILMYNQDVPPASC